MNRKAKFIVLLFTILALALVLTACGTTQTAKQPEPPKEPAKEQPKVEQASYVGSQACKTCHAEKYNDVQGTLHVKKVQDPKTPNAIIADFNKEGNPLALTGKKKEDIVFIIGAGEWKQRYAVKEGDKTVILPKQWITKTKVWEDYNPSGWKDKDYVEKCIGCHAVGYDPATNKWTEGGVSCESCHGPASNHVKSVKKADIFKPTAQQDVIETCGYCHSRGFSKDGKKREFGVGWTPGPGKKVSDVYDFVTLQNSEKDFYPDGTSKSHHQQYLDFKESKMFKSGKVSCTSCHDPHKQDKTAGAQLKATIKIENGNCITCHEQKPMSTKTYMPKLAKSAVANDITTHTFWDYTDPKNPKK